MPGAAYYDIDFRDLVFYCLGEQVPARENTSAKQDEYICLGDAIFCQKSYAVQTFHISLAAKLSQDINRVCSALFH